MFEYFPFMEQRAILETKEVAQMRSSHSINQTYM
jgi:hypothetical protein